MEALCRIINNLVENALKYTPEKGSVDVELRTDSENIFFSVKDNGIGISPEMQNKVFAPYYQVNHIKKNVQGMGLGLSIVKKIAEGLDGKIMLKSNPDKKPGAEFIVAFKKHILNNDEIVSTQDIPLFRYGRHGVE